MVESGPTPPLPFKHLEIHDGQVLATSSYGPLAVVFSADVNGTRDGAVKATADVDLSGGDAAHLPGKLDIAMAPDGVLTGQFKVEGAAADWGPISARALRGIASFKGQGGIDTLHIAIETDDLSAYDSRFREAKATLDLGDSAGSLSVRAVDAAGQAWPDRRRQRSARCAVAGGARRPHRPWHVGCGACGSISACRPRRRPRAPSR